MIEFEMGISHQNPKAQSPLSLSLNKSCTPLLVTLVRQCHKGGAESYAGGFDQGVKCPVGSQAGDMGHPYGHGALALQEVSPSHRVLFPWRQGGSQAQHLVSNWVLGLFQSTGFGPHPHGGTWAEMWLLVPGLALLGQQGESGPLLMPSAPLVSGAVEITQFPLSQH